MDETEVMSQKLFISIPQFAKMVGLDYKLARELVLAGSVPSKIIGRRRRIRTEWAEQWMSEVDELPSSVNLRQGEIPGA